MAKKITAVVKLQLPAGKATPAPPVGSTLGPFGINLPGFTKEFNAQTADKAGLIIPGRRYDLSGSFVHVRPENSARTRSYQEGAGAGNGKRETQQRKSGQAHQSAGGRNRENEDARFKLHVA